MHVRQGGFDGAHATDLIEIGALVTEFAHLIDHGRAQHVADLFTPSGWYGRENGGRSVGRAAIRSAYAARASRHPQRVCRHLFTNLRIAFDGDDTATGLSTLMLFAGDGATPLPARVSLVQDYLDSYERVDGRWLFASRETRRLFADEHFEDVLALGATA